VIVFTASPDERALDRLRALGVRACWRSPPRPNSFSPQFGRHFWQVQRIDPEAASDLRQHELTSWQQKIMATKLNQHPIDFPGRE
jgi:hypothetical protein